MLIDFIPMQYLPRIIVWIDWNFYAYKVSLAVFIILFINHYMATQKYHDISGILLSVVIGVFAWLVYCAIRYGYAVG